MSLRLRNYPDAIDAFSHAIKIKPNSPEVCYNIGLVLSELGKVKEAINAFDKAIKLKPDFVDAFDLKGLTLAQMMNWFIERGLCFSD